LAARASCASRFAPGELATGEIMSRASIALGTLRTGVQYHKAELALTLRVTVAAVLAFVLSNLLHIPLSLWTVLTAVILTHVSFGRSLKATIDYMVGTVSGAIYAGTVAALVPHENEIALAGVLAIAVAPLALLGAIKPSFSTATFTGVLVLLIPGFAHVGAIESAIYRVVEVAVGGVTALIVSLVVVPTRAHALVVNTAAQMLHLMARALPELMAAFNQAPDATAIGRLQDSIGEAFARLDPMATEAGHERISFLATEPDTGPLLRTLLRLRHDFVMIGRAAAVPLPEEFRTRFGPLLAHVAAVTANGLSRRAEALIARRGPPLDDTEATLEEFADAFAAVRREGLTLGLPVDMAERIFTLGFALDQLRMNFRDLDRWLREAAHKR
jgi:uncharacterized membrane protein YccC